jgi:hypothetical protein
MAGLTITAAGTYDGAGATVDFIFIYGAAGSVIIKNYIVTGSTLTPVIDGMGGGSAIELTNSTVTSLAFESLNVAGGDVYFDWWANSVGSLTISNCYFNPGSAEVQTSCSIGTIDIVNSLFVGTGTPLWLEKFTTATITNSNILGGTNCLEVGYTGTITLTNNILQGSVVTAGAGVSQVSCYSADPLFVSSSTYTGIFPADYFLSQIAAGEAVDSPCVGAASSLYTGTTRTDGVLAIAPGDIGFHYPEFAATGYGMACIFGPLFDLRTGQTVALMSG